MKYLILVFMLAFGMKLEAQIPDSVYTPNIYSVKLFLKGNQLSLPRFNLEREMNRSNLSLTTSTQM